MFSLIVTITKFLNMIGYVRASLSRDWCMIHVDDQLQVSNLNNSKLDTCNGPFPSSCLPPLQSESKCEVFLMKISFHSYVK